MSTTYKTPQELIEFLKTNPPKAKGQFELEGGKCCLGHYASLCGIRYHPAHAAFGVTGTGDPTSPAVPADHWLHAFATAQDIRWLVDQERTVQEHLYIRNDGADDFGPVIEFLETVVVPHVATREGVTA